MVCEDFEQQIAWAAGGDLDAAETETLDRHLESCAGCRRFAADLQQSQQAVRMLAEAPIDQKTLAGIRAKVRSEIERTQRASSFLGIRRPWLAAAAGLIMMLGGLWNLQNVRQDVPRSYPNDPSQPTTEPTTIDQAPVAHTTPDPLPPTVLPSASETSLRADDTPRIPTVEPVKTPPTLATSTIQEPSMPGPRVAEASMAAPAATPLTTTSDKLTEPMVIKLVAEEADLVIYWLVQPLETTPKETTDEISSI